MPSCLSTGVKLGRRLCRCASCGVVAEETRNSVKEEPGVSSGGEGAGPSSGGAGAEQRRRRIAEASSVDGTRGRGGRGTQGHGAVLVASGGENVGAAAKSDETRGGGKEGRTVMPEEKTAQWQRRRTTISRKGGARLGCRRSALQWKDRSGESRLTLTMTVDNDGDGGSEACAAAGIIRQRRSPKFGFVEKGVEEDGLLVFTLFWVLTYIDMSLIVD
ncbi:hypothetical protein Syun_029834 [Stephania yunnanensis]|uniref:Uncharacterized protein n=1 Tax=Stephania yunnanensis TaxID=152371 RepID=A0AAP0E8P9_9MAGN